MTGLEEALIQTARAAGEEAGRAAADEVCGRLIARIDRLQPSLASQLRTIPQMAQECKVFSRGALEKLVQRAHTNGLDRHKVVIRKNGRVFIHRARFDEWLES